MSDFSKMFVVIGAKIDEFMKKTDTVKKRTSEMADHTEKTSQRMAVNWDKVGIGIAVVGAGIEAMARKQAPLTEQTRKLAASLDMTEQEMRKLVASTSNVTFGLEEVLEVMERGRQQGIVSAEALQKYANYWDMVGDATGESAAKLAEASSALRAVNIAAGNESEATAAFGYIMQETTSSVSEFLTFIERTGPQLRQMNMGVNDAAAILGVLEHELGLAGRTARTEFRKAVNEANGDVNAMYNILGITTDQVAEYNLKVAESSDLIERNAEIHARSYTPLQKFQQWTEKLAYSYGGLFDAMSALTPVMIGMPAIISAIKAAKKLLNTQLIISQGALAGVAGGYKTTAAALLGKAGLVVGLMMAKEWADKFAISQIENWQISERWKTSLQELYKFLSPGYGYLGRKLFESRTAEPTAGFTNIPKMHTGGVYRAPTPGGAGLALLKDRETVLSAGQTAGNPITNIFNLEAVHIREEADIEKVARQFYNLQRRSERGIA